MIIENKIRKFFEDKPNVVSVDLFGSYAQQRETASSDVDIAILCDYNNIPTAFELIDWREDLEAIIHKKVDLVCLNDVSPILGMQVDQYSKNLLMRNNRLYDNYQMKLFTMYAELKELRLPMEKNILERKINVQFRSDH